MRIMGSKAFTTGCLGTSLSSDEIAFFRDERPWGFILFLYNISEPAQVQDLCAAMRDAVGDPDAPILIDQEGGRVQRFRPPHWAKYPAAGKLAEIYHKNPLDGLRATWLMSRLLAFDLLKVGVTINCLPVLDVLIPSAHDAIGDRSYGQDPDMVTKLGRAACDGLLAGGVMPVIKHMPGQGRSKQDSHLELPVVTATLAELEATDFVPFKALSDISMAMTAHIVYQDLDAKKPATTSSMLISEIIRKKIGFDGLLMSDDVSMNALSGDCGQRSKSVFDAGCDIVLHCNGKMDEMQLVAANSPELSGKALERATKAMIGVGQCDESDEQALRAEFAELTAAVCAPIETKAQKTDNGSEKDPTE